MNDIWKWICSIFSMFSPIFVGVIIAFVLNAPVQWINKGLHAMKFPKPWSEHKMHVISILLTVLLLVILGTIISVLIIPNMVSSMSSVYYDMMEFVPKMLTWLEGKGIDTTEMKTMLTSIDITTLTSVGGLLNSTVGLASKVVGTVVQLLISSIFALYILFDKHNIKKWCMKIAYAFFPKKAESMYKLYERLEKGFFDFFTGLIMEACILGTIMFLGLSLFKLPYSLIISLLAGLFSFVPYLGAWSAGCIGFVFVLWEDPTVIVTYLIVYVTIQMIECQLIYPHVVGNKAGLPPLLTLGSVIIGGKLFGILGMVLFIPIVSVLCDLFVAFVNKEDIENGYTEEKQLENETMWANKLSK